MGFKKVYKKITGLIFGRDKSYFLAVAKKPNKKKSLNDKKSSNPINSEVSSNNSLNPRDVKNIAKLDEKKENLEKKIDSIDDKIIAIQKSTHTTFKLFVPLHDSLRLRLRWYYSWHLNKYANIVHLVVLSLYIILILFTATTSANLGWKLGNVTQPEEISYAEGGITVSGAVYTADDKSTNIGTGKTIGLSIDGGTKSTVETTSGGVFSFADAVVAADDTITIFVDDETEEGTFITQAIDDSTDITGVEAFTSKVVLSHETSGPMTNTLLDTADNCGDDDVKVSVSTSNATFTSAFELWIPTDKTYTPGGTVSADSVMMIGDLNLGSNAASFSGDFEITDGEFTTTGTVTFNKSSGTQTLDVGSSTNGGWIVSGATSSTYNGTYAESGTYNSQPAYTNGSRWLYYSYQSMSESYLWVLYSSKTDLDDVFMYSCYYDGTTLPGTWYSGDGMGTAPTLSANSGPSNTFQNLTKSVGGTLQVTNNDLEAEGTLTISSSTVLDINSNNLTAATLSNEGTLLLEGGETVDITSMDINSGTVEYNGTSTYTSLAAGDSYYGLKINGSGASWTLDASLSVVGVFNINLGTLNASSRTVTLSGSSTPLVVSGTFTPSTSTIAYTGSSATNVAGTTYYNLTINQSGTTFTAAGDITIENILNLNAGTFDGSSRTITLESEGTPFVGSGTFTYSTSTVKYLGADDTTIKAIDYYNLETSPSDSGAGGWVVSGAGTTAYNGTYAQSGTYNGQPAYTDGTRWLYYNYDGMGDVYIWVLYSSKTDLWDVFMYSCYYTNGTTLPGTWYSGDMMGTAPTLSAAPSTATYTFASGTVNISGDYTNGDGTHDVVTTTDTNDPVININGDFDNSSGATFTASASAAFSVASDFTNNSSAVFTHSSGTLALDGQGAQSITVNSDPLYNLTITNASISGVIFVDALTVAGTFTDVTASSKITFGSGLTYAFANININGQATGTRVVLTSSGTWNFNVSQSTSSASYVDVTNSDASGGNNIDATVGSNDGTGNTNWTFTSAGITVSGTVYTAEDKGSNIGASKTVALSIDGASASTVETTTGGVFEFTSITVAADDTVALFLDGETEKASYVTQAANAINNLTSLELYSSHIVLSHETAGPMTNILLATANDVSDTDLLVSVDGSSIATFTTGSEVWIFGGKTYTPGANVTLGSLDILSSAIFSPGSHAMTITDSGTPLAVNGTFTEGTSTTTYTGSSATNVAGTTYYNLILNQSGTTFTAIASVTVGSVLTITAGAFDADDETIILTGSGTPFLITDTFTYSTSTIRYTGEDDTNITATTYYNLETKPSAGGSGDGWTVSGAGTTAYNDDYVESGTYNSQTAYTNGSKWLYYAYDEMGMSYMWVLNTAKSDCMDCWMDVPYYDGTSLPGTWYVGESGSASAPTLSALVGGYDYTFASGTITVEGNYINGDGTHGVNADVNTNDPIVNINGSFTNSASATFIASASASFSVASDYTNSGKYTDSSASLVLDGQGQQDITAGGTDSNYDFYNLTTTNSSSAGIIFADSATVSNTFTDTTASSKVTFHSGSTYAFNALSINGQASGTRVTLTSSSAASAWNLNVTESSPSASYVSVKDSNANKDIDATTGGYDNTGNTHWLFPTTLNVSGTVYTAEDKATNIGASKTVALSIDGGTATTVETTSGGVFTFEDVSFGTNNSLTIYVDGETEKGSLVTIAANGTSNITGLEIYTDHIVLSYESAGPMTNTVLATADNAADSDMLFSVDGSSVATFTNNIQVWVSDGKTYTPGAAVSMHDINVDGVLTLAANGVTVSGSWDSTGGTFSSSGTVTFSNSSGTESLITGGPGGSGGYTVSGAGTTAYNGDYTESGTNNGEPAYTDGTRWLYSAYDMMGDTYVWALYTTKSDCTMCDMDVTYYDGATLPGTWYVGTGDSSAPTISVATSGGGSFTNLTKTGNGILQVSTDEINITGTLSIGSGATFDLNGQEITLETMSNDGIFKLQGAEATTITTPDVSSGTIEYSGSSSYSSLLLGDSYAGLKINGSGSWTLDANLAVSGILNINSGTLNASSRTITLSGSGTPFVVTGTFSESSSTIKYTGSSATNIAGTTYFNLELDYAGTTFTSLGNTTVNNVFTITNGTVNGSTYILDVKGDWTNSGIFNGATSTVTFSGTSNQSVTMGTGEFYNLTITNATSSPGVTFVDALDVDNLLTDIAASSTLTFTAGTTSTINDINLDGQADGTKVVIRSTTTSAANWTVASVTQTDVSYVSASYNDASTGEEIDASNGTNYDGGNTTNWLFAEASGVTISGTIYTAEDKGSNIGADKTVALSINGASASTVETTSGGAFSFSSVTLAADNTVALYLDEETEKASLITQATDDSTSITSLELFTGNIMLSHQTAGPMTNTLLATADNVSDSDLLVAVDGSSVATFSNTFWVITGKTYTPGAVISATSANIDGTFSLGAYGLTVSGSWDANNGSISSSGTVTFDGTTGTISIGSGGQSFNNLIINDSAGDATFQITTAFDVNGTFVLTDGVMDLDTNDPTLNIAGNITINGGSITKSSADSAVTFDGDLSYDDNVGGVNFGDITIGTSPDTTDLSSDFTCDSLTIASGDYFYTNGYEIDSAGNITINSTGTLDATDDVETDDTIINIAGDWSNSGTFTADAGKVIFDGAGAQSITAGGTAAGNQFYNLTVTNASASGVTSSDSLTLSGTFTDVTASSVLTFNSGSTYSFANISINGQSTSTRIKMLSSSSGTVWNFNVSQTSPTASNVEVRDSDATSGEEISAMTGGFDLGGNDNWLFPLYNATISGVAWEDASLTSNLGANKTIGLSINGGTKTTVETDADGKYSFVGQSLSHDDILLLFLDDETEQSNLVFRYYSGNPTGLAVVKNHVRITPTYFSEITNTQLAIADNLVDDDVLFSVTAGDVTVDDGKTLWVRPDKIYKPGGNIIVDDILISGTLTAESNNITVSGSWDSSSGSFTTSGNVNFDASSGTETVITATTGSYSFNNLTKSGGGTLQVITNGLNISGTLTTNSSTVLDINGKNLTAATLSNGGTLLLEGAETVTITSMDTDSGTVEYDGATSYSSLAVGDAYYSLKLNNSGGSWALDANLAVAGVLDINAGTLNASTRTITLSGSGTPLVVTGTFTEGTSTVTYTGTSVTNVAGTTYNNLILNQTGTTFTSVGATTVKSVLTITAGTFNASDKTIILEGAGTPFVKTGTFTSSTSTIRYTGEDDTNIVATTYYNLETKPSAEIAVSDWVVSGAGTTSYDGDYTEDGTYNGKPYYTLDDGEGNGFLWWCLTGGSRWVLTWLEIAPDIVEYYGTGTDLPATPWSVNVGTAPAPTVFAPSGAATYTFASGTVNIEGNYINGDGTNGVITTADANDPTLNIDGGFTNSAGATFTASASASFSVASNFTNNATATFTHSSGTLTLDGQSGQSITSNTDAFYNLTSTNASASPGVTFVDALDVDNLLTDITASSTLTFTAGTTSTINDINLDGQADGTKVVIRSTTTSDANWTVASVTQTDVSYVSVSYNDASTGEEIDASNGTNFDGGNTVNWDFVGVTTITFSGTCKQYDQSSNCADSEVIKFAVNGTVKAQTGSTSSGSWTITDIVEPSSGDVVTVFIDGVDDQYEAVAITKWDGSGDILNLNLFERHLNIGSDDNQTITNANISQYDNSVSSDEDIFFEVDASNDLTIPATATSTYDDQELYILASNTYRPDSTDSGNVETPNLEIPTSAVFTADGNTIELTYYGTPFTKTGTFNYDTSTFKYTAHEELVNITATTYNNLEFKPSYTAATCSYAVSGAGSSAYDGDYVATGTYNSHPYYVSDPGEYLCYDNAEWTLTDNLCGVGAYWDGQTLPGSWSVGGGSSPAPTVSACSGYTAPTYSFASGTINVEGNFTNGNGSSEAYARADLNNPILNVNGNFDNFSESTFIASQTAAFSVASDFTNDATATFTHLGGTLTLDGQGAQSFTAGGTGSGHTPYNLTVTNNSGPTTGITFADSLTLATGGTFTDVTNDSKLIFTDGATYSFPLININGTSGHNVIMTWASGGHGHWHLIVPGTPTVTYVTVDHSDATGSGAEIDATSNCTDGDDNTYWDFGTITFSGTCKQYDQSSNCADSEVIKFAVNGTVKAQTGSTSSGSWTITDIVEPSSGDVITIFIDNVDDTYEANAVTKYDAAGSLSGVLLYERHLTIGSSANQTLTNANLSQYDNSVSSDEDIFFEVDSNNDLLVPATSTSTATDQELYVLASNIYQPDSGDSGNVVTPNLEIPTSAIFTADGNTIELTGGDTSFTKTGTFNYDTSTFKYTAEADTNITATTYYNLETKPSGESVDGDWTVSSAGIGAYNGDYYAEGTYNTYTYYIGPYPDNDHYLYCSGPYWHLSTVLGDPFYEDYISASSTLPGNPWDNSSDQSAVPVLGAFDPTYTYTFAFGTVNIEGDYTNGDGSHGVYTIADSMNVNGDFDNSADATFTASQTAAFSVASDFTNDATATFIHLGGTLTLDGQGAQSITTGGDAFWNLTVTNASASPGVTFVDALDVDNLLTDITASSTLTFTAGTTSTINDINLDGQADGTKVTVRSTTTSAANWNVTAGPQTDVSYVSVSYNNASSGEEIDASNGTNYDGGNTTNWLFNVTPVNDSLTFANPYSSNIAIADDTTEWNFRALVTDADGSTDLDYVEMRLANSSDSAQPYDSLKYRWTESSDTFSEQADTQDAGTITSDGTNSSADGNQWTLDFKIKFDSDFLAKDTEYSIELYALDDDADSDTDNYTTKYQVTVLSITIEVDSPTIVFGNLLPGSILTDTTICTITTNFPNGYSLSVHDSVVGTDSVLLHTDASTRIADYVGTIALPTLWADTGLGISLYSATDKEAKWGTGTTETDSNNKYAGVPETATLIHEKTGSPTSADTNSIGYKLIVPNTQKTGDYSGTITYTATGVLN